jgi:hypothetical protein
MENCFKPIMGQLLLSLRDIFFVYSKVHIYYLVLDTISLAMLIGFKIFSKFIERSSLNLLEYLRK